MDADTFSSKLWRRGGAAASAVVVMVVDVRAHGTSYAYKWWLLVVGCCTESVSACARL